LIYREETAVDDQRHKIEIEFEQSSAGATELSKTKAFYVQWKHTGNDCEIEIY